MAHPPSWLQWSLGFGLTISRIYTPKASGLEPEKWIKMTISNLTKKKTPLSRFKGSVFRVRRFLKCSLEWVTVSQLRFPTRSCKWERVTNCHQRTWHHRRAPTGSQKSSRTSVINAAVQAIQRIEMRENTRNGSQSSFFQLCYIATVTLFIALGTSFISLMVQKCSPGPQGCNIDRVPPTCRQLQSSNRCVACHQCDSSSETLEACHVFASGRVEQNKLKLCDVNWNVTYMILHVHVKLSGVKYYTIRTIYGSNSHKPYRNTGIHQTKSETYLCKDIYCNHIWSLSNHILPLLSHHPPNSRPLQPQPPEW